MTPNDSPLSKAHDEVWLLLPWYVNGSLEGRDLKGVAEHLRQCLPCRREVGALREFAESVSIMPTIDLSPEDAYARLSLELRPKPAPPQPRPWAKGFAQRWTRPGPWFGRHPLPALVLVFVAVVGGWQARVLFEPDFHTLANSGPAPAVSSSNLQVVFVPGLGRDRVVAILDAVSGQVIEGPSESGLYLVRLQVSASHNPDLAAALADLRKRPEVLFAEPLLESRR